MIGVIGVELSFFQSLLFGFLSGLSDILPVSSQAHKAMLLTFFGAKTDPALLRLLIHGAIVAALYMSCRDHLKQIFRQVELARVPKRRRKRPLDVKILMEVRFLKVMVIPVVIACVISLKTAALNTSLQWIALLSLVNATILFLPRLMPTGNKDARSVSAFEGMLMGICGGIGILPGISSMGGMLSIASMCGIEGKFALTLAMMMQMVMNLLLMVVDVIALITGAGGLTFGVILGYIFAAAAAFGGVFVAVRIMRSLSERTGYAVFTWYSAAVALLSFIFYLMV